MEISDLISSGNPNIAVCHSSRCDGASEIIPNSTEEVYALLKLYAPAVHQHLNNAYLIIYHKPSMRDFGYIDLINLKENIRNKNLNKITND
jgi:hypothetical protein